MSGKKQFRETEKASEPDSNMVGLFELSDQKFKTTMVNMLSTLIDKIDSMQEQIGNVSIEMIIVRKSQKKNSRDQKAM